MNSGKVKITIKSVVFTISTVKIRDFYDLT